MASTGGYMVGTRHPWPCLLFVLPLLVLYELGVLLVGGPTPETVRNGADHWLRSLVGVWTPPLLLTLAFLLWAWSRWSDRPGDLVGVLSGMVLEGVIFALGLWALSRALAPVLYGLGVELNSPGLQRVTVLGTTIDIDPAMRLVVTYVGAGIYEEALFRLMLFSALVGLLRWLDLPRVGAVCLAALGSAALFSVAHHVGPYGQDYNNYVFLFRLLAGLYFAALFQLRGFGIAVGAHAIYNVMVSIA